jgi:hypothetical protein
MNSVQNFKDELEHAISVVIDYEAKIKVFESIIECLSTTKSKSSKQSFFIEQKICNYQYQVKTTQEDLDIWIQRMNNYRKMIMKDVHSQIIKEKEKEQDVLIRLDTLPIELVDIIASYSSVVMDVAKKQKEDKMKLFYSQNLMNMCTMLNHWKKSDMAKLWVNIALKEDKISAECIRKRGKKSYLKNGEEYKRYTKDGMIRDTVKAFNKPCWYGDKKWRERKPIIMFGIMSSIYNYNNTHYPKHQVEAIIEPKGLPRFKNY